MRCAFTSPSWRVNHPRCRSRRSARTAYSLGHALEAKRYLERALNAPGAERQSGQALAQYRDLLRDSNRLLELYPSSELSLRARSERIRCRSGDRSEEVRQLRAKSGVRLKRRSCPGQPSASSQGEPRGPLASLTSHFKRHRANAAPMRRKALPPPPSAAAGLLGPLADRWKEQPSKLTGCRARK